MQNIIEMENNYYSRWSKRLSNKPLDELIERLNELEHKLNKSAHNHVKIIESGKGKTQRAAHSRNSIGVYRDEINAIKGAIEIINLRDEENHIWDLLEDTLFGEFKEI